MVAAAAVRRSLHLESALRLRPLIERACVRGFAQASTANGDVICDWWGQSDYLLSRSAERISIVLAFAPPHA